jgi:3-phenylpropionate/trans-cinnamate dioxygenase ferredoxin reductase subunit
VTDGVLIVGASQAGVQLATSLRDLGYQEPISLVGAEPRPPYQRPPLSKALLLGRVDEASLVFRASSFYADRGIEVVCGERVREIALPGGGAVGGGVATTESGRSFSFAHLALTVGARPRRLAVPGADLDGVCYVRDVDDALRLRRALGQARDVVVIGGGYIGLEAASAARSLGRSVTVVEAAERLLARSVVPIVSDFYRAAHERRGVDIRLGVGVTGLTERGGRVAAVVLSDGTELPADLVLVGIGAAPRTELAEALGLGCDGGIVVDRWARTSDPKVVAAGDCTVGPHPVTGEGRVRLESVQNAVVQAKVAAAALAGRPAPGPEVPWFWSDQYDLKLQIAGLSAGYDDHVVRGDPDTERFSVLYYREGALLAVDAVNNAADYLAVRKALAIGVAIPAAEARDAGRPLKSFLVPAARSA